jgi:hypothetical protein
LPPTAPAPPPPPPDSFPVPAEPCDLVKPLPPLLPCEGDVLGVSPAKPEVTVGAPPPPEPPVLPAILSCAPPPPPLEVIVVNPEPEIDEFEPEFPAP